MVGRGRKVVGRQVNRRGGEERKVVRRQVKGGGGKSGKR